MNSASQQGCMAQALLIMKAAYIRAHYRLSNKAGALASGLVQCMLSGAILMMDGPTCKGCLLEQARKGARPAPLRLKHAARLARAALGLLPPLAPRRIAQLQLLCTPGQQGSTLQSSLFKVTQQYSTRWNPLSPDVACMSARSTPRQGRVLQCTVTSVVQAMELRVHWQGCTEVASSTISHACTEVEGEPKQSSL